jgi:FMN phosphatase YigB (HAD superfamily)
LNSRFLLADFAPVRSRLSETLINRFWGKEGYELHSDVHPFLSALAKLPISGSTLPFSPPAITSNTDPSVSRVLRSLGVLVGQTEGGIKDGQIWTTYEMEEEKGSRAFWQEVLQELRETDEGDLKAEEVLVIGDELQSYVVHPPL